MIRMFVRHTVHDYKDWRKGYDAFDAERRTLGVTAHGVYQGIGTPNDVTVWHDFANIEKAKSFAQSKRLMDVMHNAGVESQPEIWFTEEGR
jgi:hypothetical protein